MFYIRAPKRRNVSVELRENLLEQARQMFVKQGIKSLTMDEIAQKMGMSKKTIYVLVRDKSELVLEVIERYINNEKKISEEIRAKAVNPIEEMILVMAHVLQQTKELNPQVLFDMQKYYPESWQIYHHYRQSYFFDFIQSNIKNGIKDGYYHNNFKIDMVVKFYIGSVSIISDQILFPSKYYTFVSVLQEYIQYHLRSIVTTKGLEELQKHPCNSF